MAFLGAQGIIFAPVSLPSHPSFPLSILLPCCPLSLPPPFSLPASLPPLVPSVDSLSRKEFTPGGSGTHGGGGDDRGSERGTWCGGQQCRQSWTCQEGSAGLSCRPGSWTASRMGVLGEVGEADGAGWGAGWGAWRECGRWRAMLRMCMSLGVLSF